MAIPICGLSVLCVDRPVLADAVLRFGKLFETCRQEAYDRIVIQHRVWLGAVIELGALRVVHGGSDMLCPIRSL